MDDFFVGRTEGCEGACRCREGEVGVDEVEWTESDTESGVFFLGMANGFGFVKSLQDERVGFGGSQGVCEGVGPFALGNVVTDGNAA